jgi:hypothetical protein
MQKLSPAEAQEFYRGLSEKIIAYLAEMDAAPHWLNDMMKISSDEIYMIPYDQIRSELQGDARAYFDLPSFAQWKTAKCDALSVQEFGDLWSITNQNPIPERLNGYYAYLKRRNTEIMTCGYQAVIMARWQLRDPGRGN